MANSDLFHIVLILVIKKQEEVHGKEYGKTEKAKKGNLGLWHFHGRVSSPILICAYT
jgi:hypothetical protein